jgi:lipoprotein signal peptidase
MILPRLDVSFISWTLALSGGVAALSLVAGFSTWLAVIVGAATLAVAWWAYLSEP